MIIETVVPELERYANELLSRMTDGRLHVRIETQREIKTGELREALDIIISDELGSRPYELYSGGEAFRINFAIRIALSKLLANRAGAQLRSLFMDEGFGTQDASGREHLVEAINSIQDDFDRILVITHIDELKEAFPARIEVRKTPDGSQFSLS
jgi:exonuclease SbcC